jgi:hypothetical protein
MRAVGCYSLIIYARCLLPTSGFHPASDATLDHKLRDPWTIYEDLTEHKTPLIIIGSMGIDNRRKNLFAKIHGRYRTIGFADIRSVSQYLIPVFSSNCRSSDSEAMNREAF